MPIVSNTETDRLLYSRKPGNRAAAVITLCVIFAFVACFGGMLGLWIARVR
jgi:hypothetical protein